MDNLVVCSVDLGSAYTKVAMRRDWNDRSQLLERLEVASQVPPYCIPSVVAHMRSTGGQWIIGEQASGQTPSPGVAIYRNWKSAFLTGCGDVEVSMEGAPFSAHPVAHIDEIALHFFRQLKQAMDSGGAPAARLRLCVPEIAGLRKTEIADVARKAGFTLAAQRPLVFEPEANVYGILTGGLNAASAPLQRDLVEPLPPTASLTQMIGHGFLLKALGQVDGSYRGVLVLDVGAFTTDVAYVRINTSLDNDEGWRNVRVRQESRPVGIVELDHAVIASLDRDVREAVRRASTSAWEAMKRRLYSLSRSAISIDGRTYSVEAAEAREKVGEAMNFFAGRIQEFSERFQGSVDYAHACALTGGGSAIASLRTFIQAPLRPKYGIELNVPDRLLRGGSALGGASLMVDSGSDGMQESNS